MNAKKAKNLRRHLRQILSQEVLATAELPATQNHTTNASGTVTVNPATFRGCYNIVKKEFAKQ
jgi:predicted neutral ceramidase superfamily lipid hydrolase